MATLKKSKKDRILAGVLGGVGKYYNVDSTIARVIWLVVLAFTGFVPGVLLYLVAAVVLKTEK